MNKLIRTISCTAVLLSMLLMARQLHATTLRSPSAKVIALWFYQLEGREVPWEIWAKDTAAYRDANDFTKPGVLIEEIAKLKASFESLKTTDLVELYTDSGLSHYDTDHECYYLNMFSANVFWPYAPNLPGREEFGIQLDNPKEFYEWKMAATRAEKLFPDGGSVQADIIMKVFRTEPGSMGMGGVSVLVAHAVSVDILYRGAKLDTIKEKSRTPGAAVAAKRAEEPAMYDIRGLKVGQTITEVLAAASKEGMKLGIIDNIGVPLNAPPPSVPDTAKELVFFTGTLAPPVGLRWQTKAEGATVEKNLVVLDYSRNGAEEDFHILEQGSTRTTVKIAAEPIGPVKAGQVCQIRYEQMFPYVESFEAKEFIKGLQEDLLANYGKPTTRKGDNDGFVWVYGEKGESFLNSQGNEEAPFEALLTTYESGSASQRNLRRVQNKSQKIAGFFVSIRAQPVKPKVVVTAPPAPTRLFGKPLTAPPTEVAPPEDTPAPTPKPRLFGSSASAALGSALAIEGTAPASAALSGLVAPEPVVTKPLAPPPPTSVPSRAPAMTYQAADAHLNRAYSALKNRLSAPGKKALTTEQKDWLVQRDLIMNMDARIQFVEQRAQELDQRVKAGY